MSKNVLRIHPSIGFARVGNSDEFYIEPQTPAALPLPHASDGTTGGLPVVANSESDTITASGVRDGSGKLKRQAARFKIFAYPQVARETYPMGVEGQEIRRGSKLDGKTVADIVWTVHVANKKAAWFRIPHDLGIDAYAHGATPALRNRREGERIDDQPRLQRLIIDPGPRTIKASDGEAVDFDAKTEASCTANGAVQRLPEYPKSFPADHFHGLICPHGHLDTLGELRTDEHGRLIVTGGYGRTATWSEGGRDPAPLDDDTDNDGWFDDQGDGPVMATLIYSDGTHQEVQGHAWVVSTDPAYAPQILNTVTLWDDVFDIWVRHLALQPELFRDGAFQSDYFPSYAEQIVPIFRSAAMQQWVTNLDDNAILVHRLVDKIKATDDPGSTVMAGLSAIRDPNDPDPVLGAGLMPLSMGDAGKSFLSLRKTQYFFLQQWLAARTRSEVSAGLNEGERLDRTTLFNCLGGRFSPGIDMSFCIRDPALWVQDWQTSRTGPFRIKPKQLDYRSEATDACFLSVGYVPNIANNPLSDNHPVDTESHHPGLEPGDVSKFMAIPWHTDYNSCATHRPDPLPPSNNLLYWSWPAQRPVAVYCAKDVSDPDTLPGQRFSIRGAGTRSEDPAQVGRYQERTAMLDNWHKIGIVVQSTAIDDGRKYDPESYLEVESQLDDDGDAVKPWPNIVSRQPAID